MLLLKQSYVKIAAWCLYDWAAASFSVIVTTFVFATYFTSAVAINKIEGTFQWANATSIAGVIIAITSPLFGAVADYGGHHKRWLLGFTLLCAISTALLWFAYPSPRSVYYTLVCVVLGTIGFETALVFYNAYLPHITDKRYLGRVSGWGWGSGYFGGILALTIVLFAFMNSHHTWLDSATAENIRITGPFVAVWYVLFALPLFVLLPDMTRHTHRMSFALRHGLTQLKTTLCALPREKNILLYLIAHMIYTDGLNTLFAFGGIYAAGTYGMSFKEVMLFGITMNITAGIGAVSLGWVDDWIGAKATVLLSLLCLVLLGVPILMMHDKYAFWGVALLLCVFVGPVQSASRTLMVRLIDKEISAEMFGLYSLSGKITAFIGPWLLGVMTLFFDSQRVGMGVVLVFFALGALLLLPVKL